MKILNLWKTLLSVKIAKKIDNFDLIIKTDESTLNQSITRHYSLSLIGDRTPIQSRLFKNSVSIIAAITTEGVSFWCSIFGTTDSNIFIDFIKDLLNFI